MNELTFMLVVYLLFCFSDFVPDVETRHFVIGYFYIAVILLNLFVHLIFLFLDTLKKLRDWCQRKCCSSKHSINPHPHVPDKRNRIKKQMLSVYKAAGMASTFLIRIQRCAKESSSPNSQRLSSDSSSSPQ